MSRYDQNRPFETPIVGREAAPVEGLGWTEASSDRRIDGRNFHPPVQMRGFDLVQIEAAAREQRALGIRLKEMAIEARQVAEGILKTPASAAHPESSAGAESPAEINDLPVDPTDIAPPQIAEVAPARRAPSPCAPEERGPHCDRTEISPSEDTWKRC